MSTLAPAIPIEELRKKLEDLNIEPRFIRGILRDVEFKALLYKNHQLCYLHEYQRISKMLNYQLINFPLSFK